MAKSRANSVAEVRKKICEAAKQSGMTQEEIGLRMGFSKGGARQAVSRLLGQENYDPRLTTLLEFAEAVKKPLAEIIS